MTEALHLVPDLLDDHEAGQPADPPPLARPLPEPDWDTWRARGLDTNTRILEFRGPVTGFFFPANATFSSWERDPLCLVCREPGHTRGRHAAGLCSTHYHRWRDHGRSKWGSVEEWVAGDSQQPLPTIGTCFAVLNTQGTPCGRYLSGPTQEVCQGHYYQWHKAGQPPRNGWYSEPRPLQTSRSIVDFRGVTDSVYRELLLGMEDRLRRKYQVKVAHLCSIVAVLSVQEPPVGSLTDLNLELFPALPLPAKGFLRRDVEVADLARLTPAGALTRDSIPLAVISPEYVTSQGMSIYLNVVGVNQPWLRDLLLSNLVRQIAEGKSYSSLKVRRDALRWWSHFLTSQSLYDAPQDLAKSVACDAFGRWLIDREKEEAELAALPPNDADDTAKQAERRAAILRMRPLGDEGNGVHSPLTMTSAGRHRLLTTLNKVFREERQTLIKWGGHAPSWHIDSQHIPSRDAAKDDTRRRAGKSEDTRALPMLVFQQLRDNLPLLGEDGNSRNSAELLLHTGRRPQDLVRIPFDCLVETSYVTDDGVQRQVNLHYTDRWKGQPQVLDLPLFDDAVTTIERQQSWVRRTYPQWFNADGTPTRHDLALFPAPSGNPDGTKNIHADTLSGIVAAWTRGERTSYTVGTIANLAGPDGTPWTAPITPYTLRHTFGQQLHDAGVPLDVIQQLMGHDVIATTQVYSKVTPKDMSGAMQTLVNLRSAVIEKDGMIGLRPLPLLSDHQAITRASVTFGGCVNKGNIAAHGRACPTVGACLNCTDFRAEVTDIVQLEAGRENRERELLRIDLGLTPAGPITDAKKKLLTLEVRRLDDMITQLQNEMERELTTDEVREVTALFDLQRKVLTNILGPLGRKPDYRPSAFTVDDEIDNPEVAREEP